MKYLFTLMLAVLTATSFAQYQHYKVTWRTERSNGNLYLLSDTLPGIPQVTKIMNDAFACKVEPEHLKFIAVYKIGLKDFNFHSAGADELPLCDNGFRYMPYHDTIYHTINLSGEDSLHLLAYRFDGPTHTVLKINLKGDFIIDDTLGAINALYNEFDRLTKKQTAAENLLNYIRYDGYIKDTTGFYKALKAYQKASKF